MNMTIIMTMNIYITKENENYLRSLQGSMSGYINGLILMDKEDAKMVRGHIVKEGRELGILPPVRELKKESLPVYGENLIETELKPIIEKTNQRFEQGLCKIHGLPLDDRGRCLQKGCKYA